MADAKTAQRARQITVVMHEIVHREFTLDLVAMCEEYDWPTHVPEDEIREVLEHSDTWETGKPPAWLKERLPYEGWREVYEVEWPEPDA